MKTKSTPVRVEADLYAAATEVASVMSRSASQQIAHWARIGREIESSAGLSVEQVGAVLRGARSYDDLDSEGQAVVRAFWRERMTRLLGDLRLDREFMAAGRPYVELDAEGRVIRRDP